MGRDRPTLLTPTSRPTVPVTVFAHSLPRGRAHLSHIAKINPNEAGINRQAHDNTGKKFCHNDGLVIVQNSGDTCGRPTVPTPPLTVPGIGATRATWASSSTTPRAVPDSIGGVLNGL